MTRRARISDGALVEAVERVERGLADADLGQRLFKQRVARPGQGRSGGFRLLLALEQQTRAVFLFGFAKSDLDNIDDDELTAARRLGAAWLALSEEKLEQALADKQLIEVKHDDDDAHDQKAVPTAS